MKTTTPPSYYYYTHYSFFFLTVTLIITAANALGSASTTSVISASSTVCAVVAGEPKQFIKCYQQNQHNNYYSYGDVVAPVVEVLPHVSFESISGGRSFFCGLRSGGLSLLCWDVDDGESVLVPKRIYHSDVVQLTDLTVGDSQVCARESQSGAVRCWRGGSVENGFNFHSPGKDLRFKSITAGSGFSCGVLMDNGKVHCWGNNNGSEIQSQFGNISMSNLVAGVSHVCGLTIYDGVLICKGNNDSGQLGPNNLNSSSYFQEFSGLALGEDFTCAVRRKNGLVQCWGGEDTKKFDSFNDVSFESIVAGLDFVCGVTTMNLSLICWGPGWSNNNGSTKNYEIPLGIVLPSPCVRNGCDSSCDSYPNSDYLCHGSGTICYSCRDNQIPLAVPLIPPPPPSTQVSKLHYKNMRVILVILIVGSIGAVAGLCTILYFLWVGAKRLFLKKKNVDNSEQPQRIDDNDGDDRVDLAPMPPNRTSNATSLGSLRRYRSVGSSSSKHNLDKIENFSLHELVIATNNFSNDNKIGSGSFGCVYKGKLADDREVAIKRGEIVSTRKKKFQEKEIAFDSELSLLSRLHHKHLVRLIGFCEEKEERLLVYEYMSNGSIHEHLHNKNNVEKSSSILNSWKMRIKIALDAARGIEYIHNYAVPSIIHRDIKSSNILLDSNWNGKVSDFGLSLIWPETEQNSTPIKAVGTVGYIDPEYYELNVLTTKSDVYGLGVVMLELLTGKRVVFKLNDENNKSNSPVAIVEYARPRIAKGELWSILDCRVSKPNVNEVETLKIMAFIAMHCVNLKGKERPEMTEIVANLERALSIL